MLPQLLKDHFTKQQVGTASDATREASTPPPEQETCSNRPHRSSRSRHPQPFPQPFMPHQFPNTPYVYPYLPGTQSGVSPFASYDQMAGHAGAYQHYSHNTGIVTPPDPCHHHQRVSGKCPHRRYGDHHAASSSSKSRQSPYWCCCSSSSR
uniref:Uncharacterized protein n=1 Tax=Ciona savignyi TaxID=51511 RepID=H2YCM8_CIOSA